MKKRIAKILPVLAAEVLLAAACTTKGGEGPDGVIDYWLWQGLGKVVVSGVWLGVMGAWSLWILG